MFYDKQSNDRKKEYKNMLSIIGSLSNLFSDSSSPMLYYRAHENCFCKYFKAENLARHDCSADAALNGVGIGLKTWVGSNNQKVAEFGKLKKILDSLDDDELIRKVSEFRNARIKTTLNMYGLDKLIYHVIIREEGIMRIGECRFDYIDIDHLQRIPKRDRDNTRYFTDGKHIYNFNKAKTTLYMLFDDLENLDEIEVQIFDDPFEVLHFFMPDHNQIDKNDLKILNDNEDSHRNRLLALKLYKETKNGCIVEKHSGLNIWNAKGRVRHPDEVYIPFNIKDRNRPENLGFFPPKDMSFNLRLPDNSVISAKVCQQDGKAIMSNPNKALGKWLLRDVLELPEWTLITYELLQEKGFDTVLFEKVGELEYKINFTDSRIYDELYGK